MFHKAFIKEVGIFKWAYRTALRQCHKRLLKRDHQMKLPTGETILLPIANFFASEAYVTGGDVDWGSEKLFCELLTGRGAFLDVGAHIGYYSLYVLPKVTAVYSFEPDPRVRPFLEKNAANRSKMEVVPSAVGAETGKARFTMESQAEMSHLSHADEQGGRQIEVDVTTVDAFVKSRNLTVEAIKIDVEGYDTQVIAGALSVLAAQQPMVLTEAKPTPELFNLAREVQYRVFAYQRHPETRAKSFGELNAQSTITADTKMLFLVPERLVEPLRRAA